MIVWIVAAVVALSFLSAAGFYVLVGRKKVDGDPKVYDWSFIASTVCLCLACLSLGAWQLSKGGSKSNNLNSLGV